MKKFLLIIILLASSNLHSQDTVSAKFFPMHVGNYYVYHYDDIQYHYYISCRITKDSIINGKRYFKYSDLPLYGPGFYRYDTLTSNLLKYRPGLGCSQFLNDIIIDSLGSDTVDALYGCGVEPHACVERNDSILNFSHSQLIYFNVKYKKGIGFYNICSGDPFPCEGQTTFIGAYINGVLFGDTTVTNLEQIHTSIPNKFHLYQNYPNPFNPATNIKFDIPKSGNVRITVYDIAGKLVAELLNQNLSPGTYETSWDADGFASGVYFYSLEAEGFKETRKMLLIK